jgi:hypothetical protein
METLMTPEIEKAVVRELDSNWCEAELGGMDVADGRLRYRAIDSLKRLSQQPSASIPQACGDWAGTKGTYGLFKHELVSHEVLLTPHREQTLVRMREYARVLVIQDSSILSLTHFPTMEGVGPVGTRGQKARGLVMHSALAVSEEGMSLGVLHQSVWARPDEAEELTAQEQRVRPIEEKESYKWLEGLSRTPNLPDTQVVTVCDAEADVYELLALAAESEQGLLVRAGQDRSLMPPEVSRIFPAVGAAPLSAQLTLNLPPKGSSPARQAKVSVHYKRVKLKPPQRPKRADRAPLVPLTLWAVLVRERNPPQDVTPLEWLLLTTVPVRNAEDALQRVAWYCQRWQIEIWHKILKSGCRIEQRRLKSADRLQACLALYVIIAWRPHWLTHLARHDPNAPSTAALTEPEWQALYAHATGSTVPPVQPPSVAQAVLWIAQLGGFLARKGDGYPGVTVLWRGWQRLQDLVAMWDLFHPPDGYG